MNSTFQLVKQELLNTFPEALSIYAFGSRVTGNPRPDSDLDLAILVAGYLDPLKLWEASSSLATKLNYDVDLLDLRAASTVMQHQIVTTGQKLFEKNLDSKLFDLYVLKEKFYLDYLRKDQLEEIQRQGKVYA